MPNYSAGAQGALGGAATGAMIGSAVPGIGTAVGAIGGGIIGGLGGLFGGGDDTPKIQGPADNPYANDALRRLLSDAESRQAPTIAGTQLSVDQTGRQGLLGTAGRLGAIASGQQQGAGEMAVNAQLGRANAAQMAAARSAQGANAALAYRNAMRNNADLGLAGAGQAAQARMQDQSNANAQLGSLYGNLYGQDIGVASQNAQLGQAAQLANMQAGLQQQQMNDAARIQAIGGMLGWDQATINAQIAQSNANLQQQQINANKPNMLANLMQGAGTLMQLKGMGVFGGGAGGAAVASAGNSGAAPGQNWGA